MANYQPGGVDGAPYYNNGGNYYQQQPPPQYGQQPQQPYGQAQYGQPPYGQPNGPGQNDGYDDKQTFEQVFKVDKPKYNDIWAGILFLLVFGGFVAVSGLSIQGYATNSSRGGGIYGDAQTVGLNANTVILFMIVLGIAFVLSYVYVLLARLFPKQFIWVTGILNIALGLATAIYMLYRHYWSGGIVFLIFVIFLIFAFITWIPRIPFSALMLKTAIDVAKGYGHVYMVSALGGLLATAFAAWYSITFVAVYVKYGQGGNGSSGTVTGLLVFITFAMYWISEWLKNTIHTTISGVYGSWYFRPLHPPQGATRGALKRSLTYSFGSISLGSLIVAIISFLRQLCSVARRSEAAEGSIVVRLSDPQLFRRLTPIPT